MANIPLATSLGVADGDAITPIPAGTIAKPCAAFQLIMWDEGAFEAELEISPDAGTTWLPYGASGDTTLTASGMIEAVFIGEGIQVRLTNASGTVSAILVPLP